MTVPKPNEDLVKNSNVASLVRFARATQPTSAADRATVLLKAAVVEAELAGWATPEFLEAVGTIRDEVRREAEWGEKLA